MAGMKRQLERELERLGIDPTDAGPEKCLRCGSELSEGKGMVGERILFCSKGCGIVWEDSADAIARVI